MIQRNLYDVAFSSEWGRQMRFITGPRQVGKTTLAKEKLRHDGLEHLYYLWELRKVRQRYKENELFFTEDGMTSASKKLWICFDEIHKMPKWKNILKGIFDETWERYRFIVTGSAKLNLKKHAGDSLAGRFFTFHLLPLTLNEIHSGNRTRLTVPDSAREYVETRLDASPAPRESLSQLLTYSGFPEPFLKGTKPFYRKWSQESLDMVIREDIGELTRIVDREYIHDLFQLLPDHVGSPLSQSSLASHIQVSPTTIKSYLRRLEDFFLVFSLKPWSKNIKRSLLKAGKYYLYDWSRIRSEGPRFENYVACEMRAMLSLWGDVTGETFELYYIRTKEKKETDFLVVRNGKPWFLAEAKLSDGRIERHHLDTMSVLGNIPFVQICQEPGVLSMQKKDAFRISAQHFFS